MKMIPSFSGVTCVFQDKKKSRFERKIIEFNLDIVEF